jgi:hypothetical protein
MITVKLYKIYAIAKLLQDGPNTKVFTNNRLNEIMNISEEISKDYDNEILKRYDNSTL